jgi:hypothetical protein
MLTGMFDLKKNEYEKGVFDAKRAAFLRIILRLQQ